MAKARNIFSEPDRSEAQSHAGPAVRRTRQTLMLSGTIAIERMPGQTLKAESNQPADSINVPTLG